MIMVLQLILIILVELASNGDADETVHTCNRDHTDSFGNTIATSNTDHTCKYGDNHDVAYS